MEKSFSRTILGFWLVTCATSWDLSSVGVEEFSLKHVSLYKSRAFLTIEHANGGLSLKLQFETDF